MAKYASKVNEVMAPCQTVYNKLSDMSRLAHLKEKLDDPQFQEQLSSLPEGKVEDVKKHIQNMRFDTDSVSVDVPGIGEIALRVIERDPGKCIKLESENSPIHFFAWIQTLPVTEDTSKLKVTLDADLNMFIRAMIGGKLQEGVDKLAEMLARIPYENV